MEGDEQEQRVMGRRRVRWRGVESDGRGIGRWGGVEGDGEAWRAMGRGRERWGGVESDGKA